jgi:hypothetical protein
MAYSGKRRVKHKKPVNAPNLAKDKDKLSETKLKQWIVKAIELLKEGCSPAFIKQHIALNKKGAVTVGILDKILSAAHTEISSEYVNKRSEVVALHIQRYNKQIKKLLAVEELDQDMINSEEEGGITYEAWMKSREKKIKAGYLAMETMFQKERLLQLHNKNFNFNFNQTETIKEVKTVKAIPDLSKLTFDEQVELYELMMEAKEDENENISVKVINQETKINVTEDIEAEIVEPANVELIKQETVTRS